MRKRLSAMLLAAAALMLISVPARAEFVTTDQGIVYQTSEGIVTGLRKVGENYYLFDGSGYMQTGVQVIKGNWYYFSLTTGKMLYGWIREGKKTYYADPSTGILYRSRAYGSHYFNADGTERTYGSGADTAAGAAAGSWVKKNKKTYYYNAAGTYVTGMQIIDGQKYFFNNGGVLQKGKWVTFGGKKYYASKNGSIRTNAWINKTYYVNGDGERVKGLTQIGDKYYYFNLKNGKLKTGKIQAAGIVYYANDRGVVYLSQFFKLGNKKYYAKEDGTLAAGLTQIGENYYFFHRKNNQMLKKVKKNVNGKVYYFQKGGKAARDKWVKIKGKWYYFQGDGTMAVNQTIGEYYVGADGTRLKKVQKNSANSIGGKYYLIDKDGKAYRNTWVVIGEDTYYAGADGAALIGLQTIDGYQYYFNEKGIMEKDTLVVVGKTVYTINKKGRITKTSEAIGDAIAAYGQKFVGNPYVYGGTSLTNGADCSGFALSVFAHFGIKLLRVSDDQMHGPSADMQKQGYKKGTVIKNKDLLPGDLVFYGSANYSSHTAIYIGNHKVVHAANTRMGIIITDIDWCPGRITNHAMRYWA